MKKFFFLLVAATMTLSVVAQTETPLSFPRKHLIEHFTGEDCGYCPYGMESIEEFLASTTKDYIWVSHHYGYGTDEYTIAANSTIGQKLAVSGAPSVVFDRTKRRVNGTNAYAFHPGYLPEKGAVPLNDADTALASVVIDRTYNAETRELTLTVHGQVLSTDSMLLLSVLIKESGMIGKQADYYGSWEGWNEFRHVKTVRAMLSAAMGDKVEVVDGVYTKTFTYTLPVKWVADNCEIVAYITKNATSVQPIINAEQIAVVNGTDGGESLLAEGISAVPVSDTYPEEGSPLADITFTRCNVNTEYFSQGWLIAELASTKTVRSGGYSCNPYLQLYISSRTKTLEAGTYPITSTLNYGIVEAGVRDDENFEINGSRLIYVYNNQYIISQWLLVDGELVIGTDGSYEINATTLNGSRFHGVYGKKTAIDNVENAVVKDGKLLRDGKVIILRDGDEYNVLGNRLK